MQSWSKHLFYRRETWRATWTARLILVAAACLLIATTRNFWIRTAAASLICSRDNQTPVEAVIIENFDVEYPLFQEAALFQARGVRRILVPVTASSEPDTPNLVSARIVRVMADVARLRDVELIPVAETEPVVLNVAYLIRHFLERERIRSVAVVVPAFRSRRSALVYTRVFGEAQIAVTCVPVLRNTAPEAWARTWHGIQQVTEQLLKLQYYRFYVLPFVAARSRT